MKMRKLPPYGGPLPARTGLHDKGIVGNGEAGLWAHHPMVYAAIQELSEYYVAEFPAHRTSLPGCFTQHPLYGRRSKRRHQCD